MQKSKIHFLFILAVLFLLATETAFGGVFPPPERSIAGHVWQDDDGDGTQNGSEPDLDGINVVLWDGGVNLFVTSTDESGDYEFLNVDPAPEPLLGFYILAVAPADGGIPALQDDWGGLGNVPPGWIPTHDPDGVENSPYEAFVDVTTSDLVDQDFGFQPASRILTRKTVEPFRGDSFVLINTGPDTDSRYVSLSALFTPVLTEPGVAGELAGANPAFACESLDDLTGKIAVISRGECSFGNKIANAETAGAVGAVVYNSINDDSIVAMVGDPPANIPAVFVGHSDGQALLLSLGETATLLPDVLIFGFTSSFGDFQLKAEGESTSPDVGSAESWVMETAEPGWSLDSSSCLISDLSDGTPDEVSPDSILLASGELAYCTFHNIDIDEDDDGVDDADDQCPGTLLPDSFAPKKNRYGADANGDFVDPNGRMANISVADTHGCSGQQIVEAIGSKSHLLYGPTKSILMGWVEGNP